MKEIARKDSIFRLNSLKMIVKELHSPFHNRFFRRLNRRIHLTPVVAGVSDDHRLNRRSNRVCFFSDVMRVLDRYCRITISLNHQKGRTVCFQVIDRAHLSVKFELVFRIFILAKNAGAKAIPEIIAIIVVEQIARFKIARTCLLYTSPSPRDRTRSRMPSSA